MPIGSDFSVDRATGDIRHTSGSTNYTVIELHRWLQDIADDASYSGDDELDITDDTPSERSTDNIITLINGYNIDDDAAQHLYDGSIIQEGGDVIYDGILVFANAGMRLEIIQNGALATNFWTSGINDDAANGISHRFLLKVRTGGADIDGRRLIGITREFGFTYSEFKINGTARGNNVLALTYTADLNNQTSVGTVAAWTNITNISVGYNGIDVNNDGSDEYFYSEWNKDTQTINDLYERMKYLTRRGETTTLYGIPGQIFRGITHEIVVDNPSVTDFNAVEPVSWAGGTGQMLAINDTNAPTKMWIQLLTGVPPTNNQTITGGTSGATCDVNVTVTERTISQPFCGQSTGSAIIGAYGFGVEALDLTSVDKVTDLDANPPWSPPNFQTGSVLGLVVGEDYVLVAPNDGGSIDFDQFTLNGALTGGAVTAVVVNGAIPNDTPATGTIRILRANGVYTRHAYTSWAGSTFTIGSTDFSSNNAANGANTFISYIDKLATSTSESFTAVYVSPRSMFIRVRDGGVTPIKTFESSASFGAGGFSVTASRITDV